jgi:formamidase
MIDYLQSEYRYSAQQAYELCSVAVQLRVSALPNIPNISATALLPLNIFNLS